MDRTDIETAPDARAAAAAVPFDALPAGSRVWVFAAPRPFDAAERDGLPALMDKVLGKWAIKQPGMRGCHALLEDRFLVVGADEGREMLDGCSVDAMMSWVLRLERETGLRLVDRMTVHYRAADGSVRSVSRPEFARLAAAGEVTDATHVFDTTVSRVDDLRAGRFELPARDAWHGRAFF